MAVGVATLPFKIGDSRPIDEGEAGTLPAMAVATTTHEINDIEAEADRPAGRPNAVRALVVLVALAATIVAALVVDPRVVAHAPVVFGLLVVSFVVLDVVRI